MGEDRKVNKEFEIFKVLHNLTLQSFLTFTLLSQLFQILYIFHHVVLQDGQLGQN